MTTTTMTYAQAAKRVGAEVPEHLDIAWDIPRHRGGTQGDVSALPLDTETHISKAKLMIAEDGQSIAGEGVSIVEGDVGRNSHILSCFPDGGAKLTTDSLGTNHGLLGVLFVPGGETAELIHTAEHGAISFVGEDTDGHPADTYYRLIGQIDPQTNLRVAD